MTSWFRYPGQRVVERVRDSDLSRLAVITVVSHALAVRVKRSCFLHSIAPYLCS